MNLNKIFLDLSEKKYTDVEVNLVDQNNSIKLSVHKVILGISSDYFDKLFNFPNNKNKSYFDIIVNDSKIAYDIILSFYGQNINSTDYPEWKYMLETFKCRSFFGLENDASKLYNIKFPAEGFNELIKICDELNLLGDKNVMKLIKKNIPDDYDISLFNQDFVKELVNVNINKSLIVSGSDDKTIKIWNMETGSCLKTLSGHTDYVHSVVLSSDDTKIISGSGDNTIKIWDMDTGSCLNTLSGHTRSVLSVVLSSDNTKIISGSNDDTIKIWDMETGFCLNTLRGHIKPVFSVVLSSDNTKIVSGSVDSTIKIWDIKTGSCFKTLYGHTDWVRSVAVTTDNIKIVSSSDDKTIKIWHMETGLCLNTLSGHAQFVYSVVLSSDNTKIVSGSADRTIKIWDLSREQRSSQLQPATRGLRQDLSREQRSSQLQPATRGLRQDMEAGSCLNTLSGHINTICSVVLSNDNTKIVSAGVDDTIKIWDMETGSCLNTLSGHTAGINSIALTCNILSELDKKLMNYSY